MTSLLTTKLRAPRRRPNAVARPRLERQLAAALEAPLTLVSAPAGFGKTTLLTEWLAGVDAEVAWLSLDAGDDDPAAFWPYVAAALGLAETDVVALLNELAAHDGDVVLVLDDVHLIESAEIHASLAFLVDHAPPQLHLVLAGRADPPMPLGSYRARGDLVEVRAAALRFSTEEAAGYLARMGLALDAGDVEALEARTEGWIAALQLAALSLQGRDDPTAFIAGFAGDDRYVVDYLVGEVLDGLTEDVTSFLLATSVLDRLSGPLCDAVTGRTDGQALLESLERRNLFVLPLDDRRRWYRYHHLFADVLRARLPDEQPEHVDGLHRRAGGWYEAEGDLEDAVAHALAGHDPERAATLVERAVPEMSRRRREATLRRWYAALPDELVRARPVLAIGGVGALMAAGRFAEAEPLLVAVEAYLADPSPDAAVVDRDELARLPAHVAKYRAGMARLAGDDEATITHAARALELTAPDDHLGRGAAAALTGLAEWSQGRLADAEAHYREAADQLDLAGHAADVLGCTLALADIQAARGRLGTARRTLEAGLARAAEHRGAADLHVALGELAWERDDLDEAHEHLAAGARLGEAAATSQHPYRSRVLAARLSAADGDLAGALALLDEAEQCFDTDYSPPIHPVAVTRARLQLAHGDLTGARRWAADRAVPAQGRLDYLHEYEHLTLAGVMVATGELDAAADLLGHLLAEAEAGDRTGSQVEALALLALAHDDHATAETLLADARRRAEPEGFARPFVDLRTPGPGSTATGLVEELSGRELDVLRLLRSDLTGPEIAAELYVSVNTLRTHTRHIYEKLGVNNRRQAVRRAEELGL